MSSELRLVPRQRTVTDERTRLEVALRSLEDSGRLVRVVATEDRGRGRLSMTVEVRPLPRRRSGLAPIPWQRWLAVYGVALALVAAAGFVVGRGEVGVLIVQVFGGMGALAVLAQYGVPALLSLSHRHHCPGCGRH